ncbi:MAG: hypothetical protein KF686_03325 [Ramlibacter sp.]|nr:hypothetical protein [Ramlibacter sp.]
MSSRIYASGVKATAIANILEDVADFIRFDASGRKVLDVNALQVYLQEQFALISSEGEFIAPATEDSSAAAAKAISSRTLASSLNDAIGPNRWSSRSDWPTTTSVLSGSALVAAVKAGQADVKAASDAISNLYTDQESKLKQVVTDFYYAKGIDADVPDGVVRSIDTRFYRYTYVTDRGEESAPSPISALCEVDQNDTVDVGAAAPPSGRNITHWRPYRSSIGNDSKDWLYVPHPTDPDGYPIAVLAFTDSVQSTELKDPLQTLTWDEPPADLSGLTEGANGGMGGFTGNQACFCENYYGYAWPLPYRKTTAWPIVGMGSFGQTYVVLTAGKPYYMTGADSASLDSVPMESDQACVSKRSIVNVPSKDGRPGGVMFASAEGLCLASANGIMLLTGPDGFNLFDLETWRALVPESIVATYHEGCYIFRYDTGSATGCYMLHISTGKLSTVDLSASAFYRDLASGRLFAASGDAINGAFAAQTLRTAVHRTPRIVLPAYASFAWVQADSDFAAEMTVKIYRDGTLVSTSALTSRKPVRAKTGRHNEWEVQTEGAVRATSVTVASSTDELKSV